MNLKYFFWLPDVTPWMGACQASLSFTISQSLLNLMYIELVMPSHPLLSPSPLAFSLSQHQGHFFKNYYFFLEVNYFTILYWFCHTSAWIHHRYTRVPHPEPPSLLPPHTIPLGRPSAPAPSILYPATNLDWRFVSYMILYMFQCHSPKSSYPLPLPQSPKDCSIHLCLFCCLAYRVIITIFLNSIYMC